MERVALTLASNIQGVHTLDGLAEELAVILFELVLQKGRLNEHVLSMFQDLDHAAVMARIQALNIQMPPPRFAGHDRWLHEKPRWY